VTESNTSSDLGKHSTNKRYKAPVISHQPGETRHLIAAETPRERMIRVITGVKKRKR
jgi:hypothetical protein